MTSISLNILNMTQGWLTIEYNPALLRYLPFGGLLPRPLPESPPVLLGAFSRCTNMSFLLKLLGFNMTKARPEAYRAKSVQSQELVRRHRLV